MTNKSRPIVASYCNTFLKPEMLHIYRQIKGLRTFRTFVVARYRKSSKKYPWEDVEMVPPVKSNFLRRFYLKYVLKEPPIVYRGEYARLSGILARRNADLLHVYFGHTGVHLLPFIKRWPKPVVVSFHGVDVQRRDNQPGYLKDLKELLQHLPIVMARSESLKERLIDLGCAPEKIRINRTGIPMDRYPLLIRDAPADGAWQFTQACRLIEKKGLDVSLRAFASFQKEYPNARFVVAGEGPLLDELIALSKELGIEDKVSFPGFLSEKTLCKLYHDSHIFIHPSQLTSDGNQEGVPNSMLEAMATGLPVIATYHGGIPEAVRHGATGLLSQERDWESVLGSMHELAGNPERWLKMGKAASLDVRDHFEQSAQITNLESIYWEVMESGS
jgi:colanic acid/amylovoran biosynthesis glycosyltransferase